MRAYAVLAVIALLGAFFILAPSASAECTPGTPGCPQPTPICPPDKPACWIIPPQSIEVNAGGVSAGAGPPGSGGAPVVLTPAQYRIEIPLVTPVPFPTRRPAPTAEPATQAGLTGEPSSSPTGITWQEGLLAAAAAAMGAVALHGTFTSPISGHASGGSPGVRPSTGGATSGSPSAGLSSARAGTGAQASASSAGSTSGGRGASSPSGGEASAFGEPTAEERRQGSGWGGVIGASPSVTWQGDLSRGAAGLGGGSGSALKSGSGVLSAGRGDGWRGEGDGGDPPPDEGPCNPSQPADGMSSAERKAEDMLPRANWIPGGGRCDVGPTPTAEPNPTPTATPSARAGGPFGPSQTARDRWWENRPAASPQASASPSQVRDRWWEDGGLLGGQPPIPTSPPTTSAAGNPPPPIDPVERFRAIASAGSKFYGAGTYFGQDKEGAVAFLTALRRLALPDASPNPSYAQIATGELTNWVSRNPTFTDGDSLLQTYESWGAARQRPSPVNYTDLADLVQALTREEGIRNLNALASLGLTLGGTKLAERDPEAGTNMTRVGGAMGATGDAWLGARLLSDSAKYAAFLKAARTPLGGVASGLGALAGGFQLYHSTELLVTDPSIADIRSNERWGVGLQALGGGLLMVGGLAGAALAVGATGAIFSALPILIPIGLAVGAVGWAVKNWDWLGGGLKAWVGIGKNSRQIVKALPSYVNDTVIRPQLQKVKEKLIEPIIRGAEAWPGILDNGKKIVQALPRYVSESVVKPVVAAVQEKVIQPAAQWLSEKVMQPAANLNARVIQPTLKALNERVAQPINNAVNKTARFFKNLFGRGK